MNHGGPIMAEIKSFEDLIAWQKAYEFGLLAYQMMKGFPPEERYDMTRQVRRSALSISSNIAEGWGRQSTADYIRFLRIARGSAFELKSQMRFAADLGYCQKDHKVHDLANEVGRLLNGLLKSLGAKD